MYTVKVMFITSPFHISYCRQHSKPELQMSALRKKGNIVVFIYLFLKNTTHWYAYNRLIISAWNSECVTGAGDDAMR
jgi:hypothetical protein